MATSFVIATLPAGQGTLALCPLPGLGGDLGGDIAQIIAFAPQMVISMTEDTERAALGAATLPDHLAKAGIAWHAFPIRDYGTPAPGADWATISRAAHAVLAQGGRVLAHCRGGLGRSGMVILRLMIELGEDPDAALNRLRAIRPGAVETPDQARWANVAKDTP